MKGFSLCLFIILACSGCKHNIANHNLSQKADRKDGLDHMPKIQWTQSTISLEGTISNIPAAIELTVDSDFCFGTITYRRSGKPIVLAGDLRHNIDIDEMVHLKELDPNGIPTGFLQGTFIGNEFNGVWKSPTSDKKLPFTFTVMNVAPISKIVVKDPTGSYYIDYRPDRSGSEYSLEITKIDNSHIALGFIGVSDSPEYNIGQLYDTISGEGNRFTYSGKKSNMNCAFSVYLTNDLAIVRTIDNRYDCGFGNGVFIIGCYRKVADTIAVHKVEPQYK